MKNVLIAVDDTKSSDIAVSTCASEFCSRVKPDQVTILYVEKFEGRSLIDEMLGDAEMATLKEALEGTEYKETLDKKAEAILAHHKDAISKTGQSNVKTIMKTGHPAEEILKAAKETNADLIIVGARGKRKSQSRLLMGSVSREVAHNAETSVMVAR
jgi:nucleotide-binding universal stress UspA family protein